MEAFGVAANIISIIHITTEVVKRLNDFRSTVEGLPRALKSLSVELPTLIHSLKRIRQAIDDGRVDEDSQEALEPMVKDFEQQIQALSDIIFKMRPKVDSSTARNLKAVSSFRYDSEVKHIERVIRGYVSTLTLESAISSSSQGLVASQPPPIARFICPFGRDPDFVERANLVDLLAHKGPGSRHALVGGGGIGKSQIAIEYGYRIQQNSPKTWVFWVDTENVTKMEEGYREFARALRINGASDKDADIFGLVSDWLRNEANGTWVMILDNADDKEVFTSRPPKYRGSDRSKQIREFVPQSPNGSVLVTSRSRDAAFQVTCNYRNVRTVEPMDETEALALLQNQLEDNHSDEEMKLLVKTVDYIPLAITQAAAHISRRSLPIPSYIQELRDGDEMADSTLDENIPQLRRTAGRSSSVVTTWRVTFEYVRKTMPSAARLLSLMCLFDRQEIPETLLQGQYGEEVTLTQSKTETRKTWWKRRPRLRRKRQQIPPPTAKALPYYFEDDWLTLRDFSLIKVNKDRKHFSMHPLVQFTTKKWLVQHQELDAWSQRFIAIIDSTFHDCDDGTFTECEPLLAHAYAAIPYRPCDIAIQPLRAWASLTRKVAHYYDQRTAFDTAQKMYRVAAEAFEITLGPAAPESLKCRTQQALMHFHIGQTTEAEAIYRHVLRLQQEVIGPEHLDTLDTMDRIGDTLAFQYRHSEAELLHVRALEIRLRDLGPKHSSTQTSLNTRGIFLLGQRRYQEAYVVWKEAYKARNNERDLGWVNELDLIGLKLQIDGKLGDAEHYLKESLAEKEHMFVAIDDSTVPKGAATLGRLLLAQEKYMEAEPLFRRALAWYEDDERRKAWPDNPERFQVFGELALTLSHIGKLGEAEDLARQCLSARKESLGPKSRETLETSWILAGVLEKQKQFEQAIELYKHAYEGAEEMLGENHEDTKEYQRNYEGLRARLPGLVLDDPTEDLGVQKQNEGAAAKIAVLNF